MTFQRLPLQLFRCVSIKHLLGAESLIVGSPLRTRVRHTYQQHWNLKQKFVLAIFRIKPPFRFYLNSFCHPKFSRKNFLETDQRSKERALFIPPLTISSALMAPELIQPGDKTTVFAKPVTLPKRAYVTFLAGNGDYVKGVVGLAKGLRKVKSAYPLVVAVLPDVPEEHRRILRNQGCTVREIEPVYPPENQTQFAMPYYVINYSKLRIWEFVEYSKMIYLDGDIQVYENIDHLFDLPDVHFYAVMDCFCEKTWSHTPQYKIGYCQQCPDKVQWPAELGQPPSIYFNAGMFVYEPSLMTYENLLKTLKITPPTPFAEQDFLNIFFKDIYKPIPLVYNLVLAMLWRHPENVELDKVKVVHYCAAGSKPWRYTGKEENMQREDIKMLVQKWWDIYNDEDLDYKNPTIAVGEAEPVNLQPFLAPLSEAGAVQYVTAPSAA